MGIYMKKVLLLGDCIANGYGPKVKELLSDIAEVVYSDGDIGDTAAVLWCIRYGMDDLCRGSDLIHWAMSSCDHQRTLDDGAPLLTAEQVLYYARRLHRQICYYAPRQIFAVSTAAGEGYQYDKNGIYGIPVDEWNRETEEYNAVIAAYFRSQGVEINDLYTLTKNHPEYLAADGISLSEAGAEAVAEQTAAHIRACLSRMESDGDKAAFNRAAQDDTPPIDWEYLRDKQ